MNVKINEEQVQWYQKPAAAKKGDKEVEPSASISAGAIGLNREATVFAEDDAVFAGVVKRGAKKIVLRAASPGDEYTPFKCKLGKKGTSGIRCRPFVQDVLVGELGLELDNKKRIKCRAEVDAQSKTVVIFLP